METNHSVNISPVTLENEIKYKDDVILTYKIQYPHFSSNKFSRTTGILNAFYKKKAENFLKYIQTDLMKSAIEDYENSIKNGYPVHQYEADLVYTESYNQRNIVSLYMDQYEYTGGAHGSTVRTSEVWNMIHGNQIPLSVFFPNNPNYIADIERVIIGQITNQIKTGEDYYFDDYAQLVKHTFNPDSFYLIPGALVFYFQQYDIAPYSSGILEFQIPFSSYIK